MGFNLSDAAEQKQGSSVNYQKPGIYDNVTVTKVNLGAASTGSKYLQFETVGANGEVGKSPQMYLNTTAPEGKPTAWSITASNLRGYIMATHNVTREEADTMLQNVPNEEAVQTKVSALLVGRKFRAKFKGVQTSRGYTIAELAGSESMQVPKEATTLKYDETRDFVPYKGTTQTVTPVMETSTTTSDDLPF